MNEVGRIGSLPVVSTGAARTEPETDRTSGRAAKSQPVSGKNLPDSASEEPQEAVDRQDLHAGKPLEIAVATLNEYARSIQRDLEFSVDSDLDRTIVQVIDRTTREVVRQIPNEVTLNLARNLQANLEQLNLQRAIRQAGVDQFSGSSAVSGIVNILA